MEKKWPNNCLFLSPVLWIHISKGDPFQLCDRALCRSTGRTDLHRNEALPSWWGSQTSQSHLGVQRGKGFMNVCATGSHFPVNWLHAFNFQPFRTGPSIIHTQTCAWQPTAQRRAARMPRWGAASQGTKPSSGSLSGSGRKLDSSREP